MRICNSQRPFAKAGDRRGRFTQVVVRYPPSDTVEYLYDSDLTMVQEPDGTPVFVQKEEV